MRIQQTTRNKLLFQENLSAYLRISLSRDILQLIKTALVQWRYKDSSQRKHRGKQLHIKWSIKEYVKEYKRLVIRWI